MCTMWLLCFKTEFLIQSRWNLYLKLEFFSDKKNLSTYENSYYQIITFFGINDKVIHQASLLGSIPEGGIAGMI